MCFLIKWYITDEKGGYYFYMGAEWERQNSREVFELIDINLAIQEPVAETLILIAGETSSEALLDYNHHVKQIYQGFVCDKKDNSMAINIIKE